MRSGLGEEWGEERDVSGGLVWQLSSCPPPSTWPATPKAPALEDWGTGLGVPAAGGSRDIPGVERGSALWPVNTQTPPPAAVCTRGGGGEVGAGGRAGTYLRLRVYLPLRSKLQPERKANQRKELSSTAYTWGGGGGVSTGTGGSSGACTASLEGSGRCGAPACLGRWAPSPPRLPPWGQQRPLWLPGVPPDQRC